MFFQNIIPFYPQNNLIGVGFILPNFTNEEMVRVSNLPKTLQLVKDRALYTPTPTLNQVYLPTQAT